MSRPARQHPVASMSRRHIEPHAFVFDGFRWHARARDTDENSFKEFVEGVLDRSRHFAIRPRVRLNHLILLIPCWDSG